MGPNLFHQNRTVSWLMSIPRSDKRSSTLRSDSGYFTYIITARRIISGELLKYRKGLLMTGTYPKARDHSAGDLALSPVHFERHRQLNGRGGAVKWIWESSCVMRRAVRR
jgi:hypothetical protein